MVQSVKSLSCKHQGRGLDSQSSSKKLDMAVHHCNSCIEGEGRRKVDC